MSIFNTIETVSNLLRENDIGILDNEFNSILGRKQGTQGESVIVGDYPKSSVKPSKPFDPDLLAKLSFSILKSTGIASDKVPENVFNYAIHACQKGAAAFVDMASSFSGTTHQPLKDEAASVTPSSLAQTHGIAKGKDSFSLGG